jgi:hypothetical protein
MARSMKASADTTIRGKAILVIAVFAALALFGIAMAIYDISVGRTVLGVLFAIVALIFILLLLIKLNSVFGTYIKLRDGALLTKSWANNFLPYDINGGFLSDMRPAKTKLTEIPINELSLVLVGTKEFVKRNVTSGKSFAKAIYPYEHSKKKSSLISSMDLFYVETVDGESSFMCIYGYDVNAVSQIIIELCNENPDLYVKVGSKEYKRSIQKLQAKNK